MNYTERAMLVLGIAMSMFPQIFKDFLNLSSVFHESIIGVGVIMEFAVFSIMGYRRLQTYKVNKTNE